MKIANETKVGILATVAIAILFIGYSFLKGNDVFSSENVFYATYDRVDGLTESKPVLVNGYQIGRVSSMKLQPNGKILTTFKIKKDYAVPKNTLARISSTDLLGSKAIVFDLGNGSVYAKNGDTLQANIQKNIMEQVEPIQKKAEALVAVMDSVLTSVNNTIDKSFQHDFKRSIESIANTLNNFEKITGQLNGIVGAQKTRLGNILGNVESITDNLKNNNEKISQVLSNMNQFSDNLAKANFVQTLDNANGAIAELQAVVDGIHKGNGSIGKLLNDDQLYENLTNASKNLDSLMLDLRERPGRYVHFSIFGRKNKD